MCSGVFIKGKAVCENLCYSGSSFTSVPSPVLNPYDKERVSGGSSSGNAVLVGCSYLFTQIHEHLGLLILDAMSIINAFPKQPGLTVRLFDIVLFNS